MLQIATPFPTGKVVSYGIASLATGFFGMISVLNMLPPKDESSPVTRGGNVSQVEGASLLQQASKTEAKSGEEGTHAQASAGSTSSWADIQGGANAEIVNYPVKSPTGSSASEPVGTAPVPLALPTEQVVSTPPVVEEPATNLINVQADVPVIDAGVQLDGALNVGL